MQELKITRTVKKKFQRIDNAGKIVKGVGGYATSIGAGFLMAKATQNTSNSEESDFADDEATENYQQLSFQKSIHIRALAKIRQYAKIGA